MTSAPVNAVTDAVRPFTLHSWLVEPELGQISSADDVKRVEPRVMALLVYLAQRHGDVVPRRDLEANVWTGMVVTDDAVTNAVIKLRKALVDNARRPQYIETIPKRGYRLIAPVEFLERDVGEGLPDPAVTDATPEREHPRTDPLGPGVQHAADTPGSKQAGAAKRRLSVPFFAALVVLLMALAAFFFVPVMDDHDNVAEGMLSLPDRPSLAVLPFENLSSDPAEDYFSDGLTDDLITDLSQLPELFLISRHSSFSYKGKTPDPREVGRELGIRYLVVGSVRRAGSTVRINVRLLDAQRGEQLWADRFDRDTSDLFAVQDQINSHIFAALSLKLNPSTARRVSYRSTTNPSAYDAYLKGMSHFWRATADDFDQAVDYFDQAIAIDPDYTDAYAALAAVHWQAYKRGWYRNQPWIGLSWEKTMGALDKALQRPSALAYFVESSTYTTNQRHDRAVERARKAVDEFPNDAFAHLALADALSFSGEPQKARLSAETGLRLDPRWPYPYLFALGRAQFEMDEMEDAAATLFKAIHENDADVVPRLLLVSALGHLGREAEARQQLNELEVLYQRNRVRRLNLRDIAPIWPYRDPEDLARVRQGLRLLAVPEW